MAIDIVSMEPSRGFSKMVIARCHAIGYSKGRALRRGTSAQVAKFLYEDVLCRHGVFDTLITDGGPENEGILAELTRSYGVKHVVTSTYHPQSNGLVERGHKPIVDALSKLTNGSQSDWVFHLPGVLWAERTTIYKPIGLTPST